ncbi:MAG: rRNA pseudouridine synthase [Bacteroidetes bacterium]|nr:rRNA pseudouridine synthase [Bacteroidota bacterium]
MSKKPFDKFINKTETGAKKKERIRQEKRVARAEKNAWFEEQKRLARERRAMDNGQSGVSNERPSKIGNPRTGSKQQWAADNQHRIIGIQKVKGQKTVFNNQHSEKKSQQKEVETRQSQNSKLKTQINTEELPLNKFISWSGVCGRREAADLVKAGKVTVNGKLITDPPFRVHREDVVKINGKKISIQKNLVYILLNKPKDYITTTDDPEGRKTVMDLIKTATDERVFPVGRLDRNTTGVMLLTNDGELAQRLTHPKYEVKKIYEVRVDKPVTKQELDTIASGLTLEDGFIQPDAVAYADTKDKTVIGIEIHSGRNRIVRRIFEHMGFKVKNLDRVMYGIFTKKNIDRGKWRFLTEKEIRLLKHLNTSFGNKKPS